MTRIELPRSIEAYFAFAELPDRGQLPAGRRGRHFTINFSYLDAGRVERMQWWWHATPAQERGGDVVLLDLRREACARFRQHIERWLVNGARRLTGGEPFPVLEAAVAVPADGAVETVENAVCIDAVRETARRAVAG